MVFIEYITIDTTGNGTDFGDLLGAEGNIAGTNDTTRGIFAGGSQTADVIQYITMATPGNAIDFGDLLGNTSNMLTGTVSDNTSGVFQGGVSGDYSNVIQYITIQSAGNSTDFGDLAQARAYGGQTSDATSKRGVTLGGYVNPGSGGVALDSMEYITIDTPGNAADFGDLTGGNERAAGVSGSPGGGGGSSNNFDRALFSGGTTGTGGTTTIEYLAIATGGATTDFGDMAVLRGGHASFGNSGRTVFSNGETGSNTYSSNMEYVTPSTPGNAVSFGTNDTGKAFCGAVADLTRGVIGGGAYYTSSWNFRERMDYVAIDTTGNSTTFGNLGWGWACAGSASSGDNTYGCWSGGVRTSDTQYIGYFERITIQTTGNASSFGSFSNGDARAYSAGFSDANYSFTAGGINTSGYIDHIDRHSITTGGTGTNIADLSADKYSLSAANNGTTAVIGGGYQSQMYNEVEEFNMSTNAISSTFGTLSAGGRYRLDATSGGAA